MSRLWLYGGLPTFWRSWRAQVRKARLRRERVFRPQVCPLEDRCLLSGDPFTAFPVSPGGYPTGITAGPDGNVWFTEDLGLNVGRITPTGTVTEFQSNSDGGGITAGPDGNVWYSQLDTIARITASGEMTSFRFDSTGYADEASGITAGPDGSLWFLMFSGAGSAIGRITTDGTATLFQLPSTTSPYGLTSGPDGNLWFTEEAKIGRFSPAGTLTEFAIPPGVQNRYGASPGSLLADSDYITAGPDGNLWFTQSWTSRIGRITPAGVITEFALPDNAVPFHITTGPDGNLWYTGFTSGVPGAAPPHGLIGRISPTGSVSQLIVTLNTFAPEGIVTGPDGNLWIANFHGSIDRLSPDAFGDGASAPLVVEQGTSVAASFSTLALSASPSTKVTIDWGDGQVSQGTLDAGQTTPAPSVPGVPVGGGQTSPHSLTALAANSYLQPGTYLAVVSFDQGNGTRATVERMIEVTSNPNANFVKQLYQDLLQRSFDPAGFAYWLNQMHQGMTRPQVVQGFENSSEYRTDSVQALYRGLLGRAADPVGLTGSLAYLMGGGSLDQVRITILSSPEYFRQRGGTNAGFLAALYEDALHRQIDPSGAESWTRILDGGGTTSSEAVRMLVAATVARSDESLTGQVQSYYESFLHRRADAPGLAAFVAARRHGMSADQVVQMVAGSDEYFARVAT